VLTLLAFAGAILFVALGGVVLSLLRLRSGGLGAPILAHWAFDGLMLLGLWI
jgi:membrane protease YdiL (CAAX protease family)